MSEMAKDNYDWDAHWDHFGKSVERNPANEYRYRLVCAAIGSPSAGSTLVDVGSGQGELALRLQALHPQVAVHGLELSAEGVARARQLALASQSPARFTQRDLLRQEPLPECDRHAASYAVCSEVLEHLDDPAHLLRNTLDYISANGRLIVTVPGGPRSAFDRHIGHRRHFTPVRLRSVLEAGGFVPQTVVRAGFPFFNLYKLAVIARGSRLIDDLDDSKRPREGLSSPEATGAARTVLRFFQRAFRFNIDSSPFGWQLLAVATPRAQLVTN